MQPATAAAPGVDPARRGGERATAGSIFRASPGPVSFLWLLGLATVGLSLVLPNQVGRLTALFGGGRAVEWDPVLRAVAAIVLSQFGLSIVGWLRMRTDSRLRQDMTRRFMLGLYRRILRFGAGFFRRQEVERINVRALEDTSRVVSFRIDVLTGLPLAVVAAAVLGAVMVRSNGFLSLCLIPVSLLSGYFVLFDRRIQQVNRLARSTWDGVRATASELVGGVAEFRSHHAFDHGLARLERPAGELHGAMVQVGRLSAWFGSLSPLVASVQTAILFAVGAALCMNRGRLAAFAGPLEWGDVIRFMLLAQLLQRPVSELAGYLLQWRMNRECIRRIDEYLDEPAPFEDPPASRAPAPAAAPAAALSYDNVSLAGSAGELIVKEATVRVEPGTIASLCGPSGCGKSTLLQPLARGLDPHAGAIRLGDRPLSDFAPAEWAAATGIVPQRAVILNDTLRGNLLLGLRRPGRRVLRDADGPLDVDRRPELKTNEDVDRLLVEVVRDVGLETDVLRKFLDAPLPAGDGATRFRAGAADLRRLVLDGLGAAAGTVVEPWAGTPGDGDWRDGATVRENLLRGRPRPDRRLSTEDADDAILRALKSGGLLDAALRLGLESPAGEDGSLLSGGQRQKIALGRILVKNPALLVLDEATASLDEKSQALVMQTVRRRFADRLVVSVSHRLGTIEPADPVLVMDRGRIVQQGRAAELAGQPGLFRELLRRERGAGDARPASAAEAAPDAAELERRLALTQIFGRLDHGELAALARAARVYDCAAGEVLFRPGDPGDELFLVLEGEVEFFAAPPSGAERVVRSAGAGEAFGELALFGGGRRSLGARAPRGARLAAISRDALLPVLRANPDTALRLLETVSARMVALTREQETT
jgi:ABC-type multidrug transport system fused ATPase/permease subunit